MITISAFRWVPTFARGQVRDLRVRWALEEAGLPYRVRLLAQGDQDKADYRALQPFGQVPIFDDEDGFADSVEYFLKNIGRGRRSGYFWDGGGNHRAYLHPIKRYPTPTTVSIQPPHVSSFCLSRRICTSRVRVSPK